MDKVYPIRTYDGYDEMYDAMSGVLGIDLRRQLRDREAAAERFNQGVGWSAILPR